MPEGPSIVIMREMVEALHLKGKKIMHVEGNTKIEKERLLHQEVTDIRSWGKHFLICFKDFTLRIHLLMFGSYRINERKETAPRLSLQFKDAELNFYTCSVKLLEGSADDNYDWSRDVMSDHWKPAGALAHLKEHPGMLACDALLQQDIFAGSGNIIKNEVLFLTKIHPLSFIGKIPLAKLKAMIKEVRDYSFKFLEWKKEFTLKQHWLAHTKTTCPRCHIPLQKQYLGKTKRRSFFCDNCQKQYS
jgi:endonuclease VIII